MNPYVQTVPTSTLAEGPHWNSATNELLYVDISGQYVHRLVPGTLEKTSVYIEQGPVSLVIPIEGLANRYVISVGRTLKVMEWDGRSVTPTNLSDLYSVEPEHPSNRFNDAKCDSSGRLWAGTMSGAGDKSGNLYRVTRSAIQTVQSDVGVSNGIAWSSDNTHMFYNDTDTYRVDVFDFNNELGTLRNRKPLFDFVAEGEIGAPDGMTIDSQGNLWVACARRGAKVLQIDSTTGRKIRSIPLPTSNITSVTFGGPNLDVLYVTTMIENLMEEEKLEQPAAGALFQITNTGSRGVAGGNNFRLL